MEFFANSSLANPFVRREAHGALQTFMEVVNFNKCSEWLPKLKSFLNRLDYIKGKYTCLECVQNSKKGSNILFVFIFNNTKVSKIALAWRFISQFGNQTEPMHVMKSS